MLQYSYFSLLVEPGRASALLPDRLLSRYDAAIPRIGASVSAHGTAVVRQLEQMGVFTLNSAQRSVLPRDKLRTLQILGRHDIGFPSTAFVRDRDSVREAIRESAVRRSSSNSPKAPRARADFRGPDKAAEAILETLLLARQSVLVQKFVSEARERFLRALVVGGRVVAAMRRRAAPDEFRSNVHRGGRTERVACDPELERFAVSATQNPGPARGRGRPDRERRGPLVLEVNSSPGWRVSSQPLASMWPAKS